MIFDFNTKAKDVFFKNSNNGLNANNVQDAINEAYDVSKITDTATGERITVTNSADAPVRSLRIDGRTEQFTTTGKNLLDNIAQTTTSNGVTFTVNEDKSITVSGTPTYDVNYEVSNMLNLPTENTYILSGCPSGGSNDTYLMFVGGNGTTYFDYGEGVTVTDPRSKVYIKVTKGVSINKTFYPMIRKSDITDATYEPYTGGVPVPNPNNPQDIKGIGDNGNVEVTVTGKNLLNPALFEDNKYQNPGGGATTHSDYWITGKQKILPNTTYTRSAGSYGTFFDANGNTISTPIIANENTFTAPNNAYYVSYCVPKNTQVAFGGKIQLEEGTVSTEYEPYKSQTVSIPIDSPLYKGDDVILKNGKLEVYRKFKMVDFPTITSLSTYTDGRKYSIFNQANMADYGTFKCTHMKEIQQSDNVINGFMVNQRNSVFMFASDETVETANAKMAGAKVLFKMEEPITEIIDTDIDLSTYCNISYISNADNANMEVEYFVNSANGDVVVDLQKEIDNNKKANATEISRLDREKANASYLNDFITVRIVDMNTYGVGAKSTMNYDYLIGKSGYKPVLANTYVTNTTNDEIVICTQCYLGYGEERVYFQLLNLSDSITEADVIVEVVFVKA